MKVALIQKRILQYNIYTHIHIETHLTYSIKAAYPKVQFMDEWIRNYQETDKKPVQDMQMGSRLIKVAYQAKDL